MTRLLQASILCFSLLSLASCFQSNNSETTIVPPQPSQSNEQRVDQLWQTLVVGLLAEPLWNERDNYDSANTLLQPMQYAFVFQQQDKIQNFTSFFNELDRYFSEAITESRGANTQFMFFVSEYLVLKSQTEGFDATDLSLHNKLQTWLTEFFNSPAWMWDREPFTNLIERTSWKLSTLNPQRSYYRAMFDEDLFAYAMMANLVEVQKNTDAEASLDFSSIYSSGKPQLEQILKTEVTFTAISNGVDKFHWLFQPGVWSEHPDHRYIGHSELAGDLEPAPMTNTVTDSAHMHRWPVWLKSYKRAFSDEDMLAYISNLQVGLAQQFNQVVYVKSDEENNYPRLYNFFDGHNGVYRYRYATQNGSGYGPFQLSEILFAGWYGNLNSADEFVKDIELLLTDGFELSQQTINTYVGPNTTRERHALFTRPEYFTNGLAELNLRITYGLLNQQR